MGRHAKTDELLAHWVEYKLLHRAAPEQYPMAVRRIAAHAELSPTLYYNKDEPQIVAMMEERRDIERKHAGGAGDVAAPAAAPSLDEMRARVASAEEAPAHDLDDVQLDARIRRYLEDADFVMHQYQSMVKRLDDAVVDAPAAVADLESTVHRLQAVLSKLKTHVATRRARRRATREGEHAAR